MQCDAVSLKAVSELCNDGRGENDSVSKCTTGDRKLLDY